MIQDVMTDTITVEGEAASLVIAETLLMWRKWLESKMKK